MENKERGELCFPQHLNTSCRKPRPAWSEGVVLNVTLFISLLTVMLNLLIIISVSHFRQLHTPTNVFILSLAVSDFLVGLLLMPLEIFRNTTCWFLGDVACVLYSYLITHVVSASVGNIIIISADRYVAICDPLHYPTRITLARAKCCVGLCWLLYGTYSVFYLKDELVHLGRANSCVGQCAIVVNAVTGTVDLILNFIFPVTVIVVLYVRVFVVAVSQARAMRSNATAVTMRLSVGLKSKKSELKAARTLGVVVFVYLMCYCPFYGYVLVIVNLPNTPSVPFLFFLFYFNSCMNPMIYALFYSWFRKAIKLIVTLQILQPGSCQANVLQ
ncbi:trace amine-associated receptor 13c-like [Poecilia latipinna]|uniref:trace amine-associated receptor 13c-like n=1 Tax=Poecilia latipinna TaxID=48699 RepID=UPI00072E5934|nr:PREDICTED: trace amine-associated receptor 13c-like [Poecilia latipinna]